MPSLSSPSSSSSWRSPPPLTLDDPAPLEGFRDLLLKEFGRFLGDGQGGGASAGRLPFLSLSVAIGIGAVPGTPMLSGDVASSDDRRGILLRIVTWL